MTIANNDKTKEVLERLKSAQEFADDYAAYIKCYCLFQRRCEWRFEREFPGRVG